MKLDVVKLDLGQTAMGQVHTERHKYDKTDFLLPVWASFARQEHV